MMCMTSIDTTSRQGTVPGRKEDVGTVLVIQAGSVLTESPDV